MNGVTTGDAPIDRAAIESSMLGGADLLLAFLVGCLACLALVFLLRSVLRRRAEGLHNKGGVALLLTLAVSAVVLWLLRPWISPSFPVNGFVEAGYIACVMNIPAAIALTWRR
ncbi:hypothetical protein [Roseomonas elaeocarpi]|uniref:Uncharacterized protein n=1 Tax=Roseomonas elaeocarpi TaxID=907779 RepID=A0ABV6JUG7_9PROT